MSSLSSILTLVNMDTGVNQVAREIANMCSLYIVPFCTVGAFASSIFAALFSGSDNRIDFTPIFRAFLLVVIIQCYGQLAPILKDALEAIARAADKNTGIDEALKQVQYQANETNSFFEVFNVMDKLADFFVELGMRSVRLIIINIRDVIIAFLYAVGPIAISLSILPMFKNLLNKWLVSFIHTHFWYLTIAVLDLIFKASISTMGVTNEVAENVYGSITPGFNPGSFILTNIVIMLCYLITPFLTSMYIGSAQSGAFMSKVAGAGIAIATMGKSVLGKASVGGVEAAGASGATAAGSMGANTSVASTMSQGVNMASNSSNQRNIQ